MDTNPPGCLVCGRKIVTRSENRERFCSVHCAEDAGGAVDRTTPSLCLRTPSASRAQLRGPKA